jgi:hypothetical protein
MLLLTTVGFRLALPSIERKRMSGVVRMPGNTLYHIERSVPKKSPETNVADIVEILKELDRTKASSSDTASVEAREPVGMTSDNYYG